MEIYYSEDFKDLNILTSGQKYRPNFRDEILKYIFDNITVYFDYNYIKVCFQDTHWQ